MILESRFIRRLMWTWTMSKWWANDKFHWGRQHEQNKGRNKFTVQKQMTDLSGMRWNCSYWLCVRYLLGTRNTRMTKWLQSGNSGGGHLQETIFLKNTAKLKMTALKKKKRKMKDNMKVLSLFWGQYRKLEKESFVRQGDCFSFCSWLRICT
jgi:hypothetical protein